MIKKNTAGLSGVQIHQKGLFNKKTFFKIIDPYNATNSFQIQEVSDPKDATLESITIDDLFELHKWTCLDLLKIDIEGAEKNLFSSNYKKWMPKTKVIYVETHDRMIADCAFTVFQAIKEFNFILYTTTEGTLIFYNKDYIKV